VPGFSKVLIWKKYTHTFTHTQTHTVCRDVAKLGPKSRRQSLQKQGLFKQDQAGRWTKTIRQRTSRKTLNTLGSETQVETIMNETDNHREGRAGKQRKRDRDFKIKQETLQIITQSDKWGSGDQVQ